MATINPFLSFAGNAEEAFNFYQSVFGGDFSWHSRYKEMPDGDKIPPEQQDKILHIALPIGEGNELMGCDTMEGGGPPHAVGNNVSVSIQATSKEEANKLFQGLSEGGTVIMPLEDAFWNAYFGMWIDKFGVQWMVNFDYGEQS